MRQRLANRRSSTFFDFTAMNMKFTASFSRDAEGRVRELFLDNHKSGSSIGTLVRDMAIVFSFAAQHGADIESIRKALGRDSFGRPLGPFGGCARPDLRRRAMSDSVEITLDLPMPVSTNKIWRTGRGRTYRSKEYVAWCEQADATLMATKGPGRLKKINGPFEVEILLSTVGRKGRDGDNFCKATLDFCQSRDVIRDDSDCKRGSWEWVPPDRAPRGCRVILRSLHEVVS
jgi:Holliday junction resolvase RusA-like endonuclease